MQWVGKLPENKLISAPVMSFDILPTLVEITGASLPRLEIDGKSLLPLVKGQTNKSPHKALYFFWEYKIEAVR